MSPFMTSHIKHLDVESGRPATAAAGTPPTAPPIYPAVPHTTPVVYTALAPPTGTTLGGVGWWLFALGFVLGPVTWALTWFIPYFGRRLGASADEVKRARAAAITSGVFFAIYIVSQARRTARRVGPAAHVSAILAGHAGAHVDG